MLKRKIPKIGYLFQFYKILIFRDFLLPLVVSILRFSKQFKKLTRLETKSCIRKLLINIYQLTLLLKWCIRAEMTVNSKVTM